MLFLSLVFSGLLLIVTNAVALRGTRAALGGAIALAAVPLILGFACAGGFFFAAFEFNALLVLFAGLYCLGRRPNRWRFLRASLGASGLAYLVVGGFIFSHLRELARLREVYPFESMADRLAYEARPEEDRSAKPSAQPAADATTGAESTPAAKRLQSLEDKVIQEGDAGFSRGVRQEWGYSARVRVRSLEDLHSSYVDHFTNSPGFGVGRRIGGASPRYLELPAVPPIPLGSQEYDDPAKADFGAELRITPPGETKPGPNAEPAGLGLLEMHFDSVADFANPKGYGLIRDREHVAGFRPHMLTAMPLADPEKGEKQVWVVHTLDLISLLKHRQPVAYLSEHLPRMDELRHAPTRPLDAFESKALAALRNGEDLKASRDRDRIRMLGAVRAVQQCLDCHQVRRGALLGAFSYKLRRDHGKANGGSDG